MSDHERSQNETSEGEVRIADGPQDSPRSGADLWGLIVVPAAIVIAVVVVVALFGALTGSEGSLDDNLARVVHGGKNERQQALFNLTRQAAENQAARAARQRGEEVELPWPVDAGFGERVSKAVGELDPDDHRARLTLAILLSTLGDERGLELLRDFLQLDEDADEDGALRVAAIQNLGLLADDGAAEAVLAFLDHEDHGLRLAAAGALANLTGPGVREGLEGALDDGVLDVRATAALSGSKLDPPLLAAADLLRDLTGPEIFAAANEADPRKYSSGRDVSRFRVLAVAALGRLGLEEDRALLERLREDSDLLVAEAAMKVLAGEAAADSPDR